MSTIEVGMRLGFAQKRVMEFRRARHLLLIAKVAAVVLFAALVVKFYSGL